MDNAECEKQRKRLARYEELCRNRNFAKTALAEATSITEPFERRVDITLLLMPADKPFRNGSREITISSPAIKDHLIATAIIPPLRERLEQIEKEINEL